MADLGLKLIAIGTMMAILATIVVAIY